MFKFLTIFMTVIIILSLVFGIIFVILINSDSENINLSTIEYNKGYDEKLINSIYSENEEVKRILSYIPECILYDFYDRGWTLNTWSNKEIFNYIGKKCIGFCDYKGLKIRIDEEQYIKTFVIWHEFGHYLYERLDLRNEFMSIYNSIDVEEFYDLFGAYYLSSDAELFAESFAYYIYNIYIIDNDNIITEPVFQYVDTVFNNCKNTELLCFYAA